MNNSNNINVNLSKTCNKLHFYKVNFKYLFPKQKF